MYGVAGGPASYLTEQGAVDEFRIFVHPVLLGGDRPVFEKSALRHRLDLVETRTFDGTVTLLRHRPAAAAQ